MQRASDMPPVPPKVPISQGSGSVASSGNSIGAEKRTRPNMLNGVSSGSGHMKVPRDEDALSYSVVQESVLDRELADQRQKDEAYFRQRKSPFPLLAQLGAKIKQKIQAVKNRFNQEEEKKRVFGYKSTGEVVEESAELEPNKNYTLLTKLQQKLAPGKKPEGSGGAFSPQQSPTSPRPPPPAKVPVNSVPGGVVQRTQNEPSMLNTKYNVISSKGPQPHVPQKIARPNQAPQGNQLEEQELPLSILASAATLQRSKNKKKKRKFKAKTSGIKSSSSSITAEKKDSFVEMKENVVSHLAEPTQHDEPTQDSEPFDPSILASKNATVRKKKRKTREKKVSDNTLRSPGTQDKKRATGKSFETQETEEFDPSILASAAAVAKKKKNRTTTTEEEFDPSILASGAATARKKKKKKKKAGKRETVTTL